MCRGRKAGMWTQSIHPGMYLSVRRLRGLSGDLVSCTPPAAGGGALGFAGCLAWAACCCWATGITAASRSFRPRYSSYQEFNWCAFLLSYCKLEMEWGSCVPLRPKLSRTFCSLQNVPRPATSRNSGGSSLRLLEALAIQIAEAPGGG